MILFKQKHFEANKEDLPTRRGRMKRQKGDMLVNVLVGIALTVLVGVAGFGVFSSSMAKGNMHKVRTQLEPYSTALSTLIISNGSISRFTATSPTNAADSIIALLNTELPVDAQLTRVADNSDSGLIGYSTTLSDPWKNPYAVYIYFADKGSTYAKNSTESFTARDAVINIVFASSGANGSGMAAGVGGTNIDKSAKKPINASASVHNTDGVDDCGLIVQIANGEATAAYFGMGDTGVGPLKDIQWILGVPSTTGGTLYDYTTAASKSTATAAGSIRKYYDEDTVKAVNSPVIGAW